MKAFDLIIFDFDGTLANSFGFFCRVINQLAIRHHFNQITADEIANLRGHPSRDVVKYLGIPWWKVPLVGRSYKHLFNECREEISLFEEAAPTLEKIHGAGVRLAIVSSNGELNIRRTLGPKIAQLFAHYSCGASFFGKSRSIRRVVKVLRCDPARTLAIGDEARDIEAAKQAGVLSAGVAWGYATADLLQSQNPSYLFETFAEITAKVCEPQHAKSRHDP